MFEAINSANHFWYAIKSWRYRDKSRSTLQLEEDNLYKSLHTSDMLSADQLPAFVKMYYHDIPVQHLRLETQLATLVNGNSFFRDLLTTGGNNGITLC